MPDNRTPLRRYLNPIGFARLNLDQLQCGECVRRIFLHAIDMNINGRNTFENKPSFRISCHPLVGNRDCSLQRFSNQEAHGNAISEALTHHRLATIKATTFNPAPWTDNHLRAFYEVATLCQTETHLISHRHGNICTVPR